MPKPAVEKFWNLLQLKPTPNGGIGVTDDLKYASVFYLQSLIVYRSNVYTVKFGRQNSIHVSPTVLWDGLVANDVSSSWIKKDWMEFFRKKIIV